MIKKLMNLYDRLKNYIQYRKRYSYTKKLFNSMFCDAEVKFKDFNNKKFISKDTYLKCLNALPLHFEVEYSLVTHGNNKDKIDPLAMIVNSIYDSSSSIFICMYDFVKLGIIEDTHPEEPIFAYGTVELFKNYCQSQQLTNFYSAKTTRSINKTYRLTYKGIWMKNLFKKFLKEE